MVRMNTIVSLGLLLLCGTSLATIEPEWILGTPRVVDVNPNTGELEDVGNNGPAAQPATDATDTLILTHRAVVEVAEGSENPPLKNIDSMTLPYIETLIQQGVGIAFPNSLVESPVADAIMEMVNTSYYQVEVDVFISFPTVIDAQTSKSEIEISTHYNGALRAIINVAIMSAFEDKEIYIDSEALGADFVESAPALKTFEDTSPAKSGKKSKVKAGKLTSERTVDAKTLRGRKTSWANHTGTSIMLLGAGFYALLVGSVLLITKQPSRTTSSYNQIPSSSVATSNPDQNH